MTINRGPGVALVGTVGTTPKEHRLAIAGQYAENAPGVPRSGLLVTSAVNVVTGKATMGYDVVPVQAVINRTIGEGIYTPTASGATSVATSDAPGSGSRWDLVWIKQNDVEKGDDDNTAVIGVTSGTASASPSRPTGSVPAGAYVIAEARVFSGTTGTNQSPNTITQVYAITAARGAAIPVRDKSEMDALTKYVGASCVRLDRAGARYQCDGTAWAALPKIDIGQGDAVPIFKSGEVAVALNAFLVGVIPFPEAFPNALRSFTIARIHTTSGPITTTNLNTSTKSSMSFVATGATPSSTIYATYQAWGY